MLLAVESEALCQTELVQNPRPSHHPRDSTLLHRAWTLEIPPPAYMYFEVDGIVSADLLIYQFRSTMSDLLQEKLAAISQELDTIKFACSNLDKRVKSMVWCYPTRPAKQTYSGALIGLVSFEGDTSI